MVIPRGFKQLPTWAIWVIIIGVCLDLAISGVVIYQQVQLQHNTAAARCWDKVLNEAVTVKQTPKEHAHLLVKSRHCAELIP